MYCSQSHSTYVFSIIIGRAVAIIVLFPDRELEGILVPRLVVAKPRKSKNVLG